jgi:two-component system cell cycle response regulator DivK
MSRTVLVIEDNERNLYLVTYLLERQGFIVQAARDGASGIERAITDRPDLVILDIQLPQMDGYEVAKTLRTFQDLERTPIVAVTSYAMPGDREKALAVGCDGYLEKPIEPLTFVDEVERLMGATRGDVRRSSEPPR